MVTGKDDEIYALCCMSYGATRDHERVCGDCYAVFHCEAAAAKAHRHFPAVVRFL